MRELKSEFVEQIDRLSRLKGGEVLTGLVDALRHTDPVVGVRVNRRRGVTLPSGAETVLWAKERGMIVKGERPRFTMDPKLHQGLYYVQDPSSMIYGPIVEALSHNMHHPVYIDACAAPGGKTTAAIDALPEGALVIANEYDYKRAEALRENVIKWGYPGVVVSRGDTSRLGHLGQIADIVAVDVPCSGEGMMRKEVEAVSQWSMGLVDNCASLQREIVANVWPALKEGGYLIYSTCTFNRRENEQNVEWIVNEFGAEPVDMSMLAVGQVAGSIGSDIPAMRFIPGCVEGEGLFVAVLRKPVGERQYRDSGRKVKDDLVAAPLRRWLRASDRYVVREIGESIYAWPVEHGEAIALACKHLDVLTAGVELARLKGRDYQPAHAAVISGVIADDALAASVNVDYNDAMSYLRGETLRVDAPRGYVELRYCGRPLGLVKNIGNRANNLYPAAWTVKSTHLPDTPPEIVK